MATTLKAFAEWADFTAVGAEAKPIEGAKSKDADAGKREDAGKKIAPPVTSEIGLVYRLEIHLPDTQNVDTFRAIFRAMREEMGL